MQTKASSRQADELWSLRERAKELRCLYSVISAVSRREQPRPWFSTGSLIRAGLDIGIVEVQTSVVRHSNQRLNSVDHNAGEIRILKLLVCDQQVHETR